LKTVVFFSTKNTESALHTETLRSQNCENDRINAYNIAYLLASAFVINLNTAPMSRWRPYSQHWRGATTSQDQQKIEHQFDKSRQLHCVIGKWHCHMPFPLRAIE